MPAISKILMVANIACLAAFLGMAFLLPLHGQSQAESRYKQLKENPAAASTAQTPGTSDAIYVVEPALTAVRGASNLGIIITAANIFLFMVNERSGSKKKK